MIPKQQTFDTVVAHLKSQRRVSRGMGVVRLICKYRGPDGLKCAAGCLIPDEKYDPSMEGRMISPHKPHDPLCVALAGHDLFLVRSLQYVHDTMPVPQWEIGFKSVAVSFGLEYKDA